MPLASPVAGIVATLALIRRDEVEQVEVPEAEPAFDLAA
jgi:hypothetical protein